ncbi:VWA domain-containing protein [Thalassolituus hydrocarboniclasticus]|uniref:VWA domain-containing protein n=1 Tax=Thalassolituus hydrocarboniclasticus TaxID=2742796 RepID=A0ABY6AA42_9GAMM|nr:VWA domain-containing protein [Thalassolituus hydrocarboniclasticus]UXD87131.1 VWA domain-containing protein [Thalassolituus hydrocarboniclasticus]
MEWLSQFHFLRPLWLLAALPALLAFSLLLQRALSAGQWASVIDAHLQPYMLEQQLSGRRKAGLWWLLAAWLIACIALAGPSVEKLPQPLQKNQDALVIMLDMSASMGAQDLKPSRAVRAIQKVTDIVRSRADGLTALVAYAGDAHTVTPLTDDRDTIENLLPSLSPFIMPSPGSRPDKAISLAQQLVSDAGIQQARLLLLTDGIISKDIERIRNSLDGQRFQLKVLAIGTAEGAPVPMPGAGFLRDGSGTIVLPQLDLGPIRDLSRELNIPWQTLSINDSDWQSLLPAQPQSFDPQETDSGFARFDQWHDAGYWLIFALLPVALLLFRRGVLFSLLLVPLCWPDNSYALEWKDLWQTPDQQGSELFEQDPAKAADAFEDPAWRGSAAYRAGDYESAAKAFAEGPQTAISHYNRGNALLQAGKPDEAIAAYDEALKLNPEMKEAAANRETAEKLKQQQEQQKEQQDGQQQDGQQQDGQQQDGQQQDGQQQDGQQQDGQQQDGQQQDGQQQNQSEDDAFARQQADKLAEQQQNESASQAAQNQEPETDEEKQGIAAADEDQEEPQEESAQQLRRQSGEPETEINGLSREEQAAMQQWLNRVPDNPGNLLQRKFLYQYRQQADQESEDVLW